MMLAKNVYRELIRNTQNSSNRAAIIRDILKELRDDLVAQEDHLFSLTEKISDLEDELKRLEYPKGDD